MPQIAYINITRVLANEPLWYVLIKKFFKTRVRRTLRGKVTCFIYPLLKSLLGPRIQSSQFFLWMILREKFFLSSLKHRKSVIEKNESYLKSWCHGTICHFAFNALEKLVTVTFQIARCVPLECRTTWSCKRKCSECFLKKKQEEVKECV